METINRYFGFRAAAYSMMLCTSLLMVWSAEAGTPAPGQTDPNPVPNEKFSGTAGSAVEIGTGIVNGTPPSLWRAFALDGGELSISTQNLGPGILFPGSPPTTAVEVNLVQFGVSQAFDHAAHVMTLQSNRQYQPSIWVRTANSGDESQAFVVNFPLFNSNLEFLRDPGNIVAVATSQWTRFKVPTPFELMPGEVFGHFQIFPVPDAPRGSPTDEDRILVALPEVNAWPVENLMPNPGFVGNDGFVVGNIVGTVPNQWRAFAIGAGQLEITRNAIPPDFFFEGSPATQSVRFEVTGSVAPEEGFDIFPVLADLTNDYRHWFEVWIRSGHAGDQTVSIGVPLFDETGTFTGTAPGSFGGIIGPEWQLIAGPGFNGLDGFKADLQFRLVSDGGVESVEIVLPRIVGPATRVFLDRFELNTGSP